MLDEQEQLAVIRGLREGSCDAWATLYDEYSVDIWRYVARLLGADAAAVGDIVQEAFLEAARSARRFDPSRGTLWSWLVGIAHHRVSDHWRQVKRRNRLEQLADAGEIDFRHLFDGQLASQAAVEASETVNIVRSTLSQLSADYASLLTAKYLDEFSMLEIAARFGNSVEAVKSKLARARREFRAKFEFLTKTVQAPNQQLVAEKRSVTKQQQ